ncbi:extracellular solute-binding protein [Paenibacillus mesophilus]|uniref:ABC transporter substrate-binding protein n=1 Tax=Paenibacillus mesophilus TaxID=2582849 RepID=UPI00110E4F8C|nr:extracellular solute-binding protein [Paenibacillus mesophilus]TMV49616.1 extracellular solute-binding protein [Paenibacillus mesophilus]
MSNKTFRKAGSLTLALCLSAAALAACSQGGSKSADEGDKAKPAAPKEPVELVFYAINGDPEDSFNYRFGDAIRKKFPDYKISYIFSQKGTTLPEMITSGTRFDITYHSIGFYENFLIPNGLHYDMTELIQKHKVDLSRFEPTSIDAIKQLSGGKMYSLPVYGNNLVLYYNKSIFDKFGVAYPKNGMTWKETTDLAKKLTRQDGGVQYMGFGMNPSLVTRMNPLSIPNADLATNTPTVNKNDLWKRFYQTFFLDPQLSPGAFQTIPDNSPFVKEKNVAMMAYLSSLITIWTDQLKEVDWDIVSLPSFEDKPGTGSQINSINFGITSIAKNKDAAMEVLNYMTSDEFQTGLSKKGIMPVLKSDSVRNALGQESVFKDKNFKAIFHNKPAPIPPKALYDAELVTIYAKYGTQVWQGKLDINTAARQAEEEAKKKIEEFMSKTK